MPSGPYRERTERPAEVEQPEELFFDEGPFSDLFGPHPRFRRYYKCRHCKDIGVRLVANSASPYCSCEAGRRALDEKQEEAFLRIVGAVVVVVVLAAFTFLLLP